MNDGFWKWLFKSLKSPRDLVFGELFMGLYLIFGLVSIFLDTVVFYYYIGFFSLFLLAFVMLLFLDIFYITEKKGWG